MDKEQALKPIEDIEADCPSCKWLGTVGDCFPNSARDLTCPKCGAVIVVACLPREDYD